MPIEVRHDPPLATIGALAFAGGQANRERYLNDLALQVEQVRQRERFNLRDIGLRAFENAQQASQRQQEFVATLQDRQQGRALDYVQGQQRFAQQGQLEQQRMQQESSEREQEYRRRAGLIDYELGARQKAELARFDQAEQMAIKSPYLDEQQRRALLAQIEAQRAGVREIPPPNRTKPLDVDFQESVLWRENEQGQRVPWVKPQDGEWQVARGWSPPDSDGTDFGGLLKKHGADARQRFVEQFGREPTPEERGSMVMQLDEEEKRAIAAMKNPQARQSPPAQGSAIGWDEGANRPHPGERPLPIGRAAPRQMPQDVPQDGVEQPFVPAGPPQLPVDVPQEQPSGRIPFSPDESPDDWSANRGAPLSFKTAEGREEFYFKQRLLNDMEMIRSIPPRRLQEARAVATQHGIPFPETVEEFLQTVPIGGKYLGADGTVHVRKA